MAAAPDCAALPDVEVAAGPAMLDATSSALGPYRLAGDRLLFSREGVADYLCERGERIIYARAPNASTAEICGSLVATALPALLWMRGEIVLHAAAAILPGARRAVAIGGASGSGKSAILAHLLSLGSTLIGDDSLCIRGDGSAVRASGLPAGYFLGNGSARIRDFNPAPADRQAASAELAALLILEMPRTTKSPRCRRLRGADAVEALLASRHRSRVPRLLGSEGHHLVEFAGLARHLPIYHWMRREGAAALTADESAFLSALTDRRLV